MKRYDRSYFDRWYRNPTTRIRAGSELRRKVGVALAAAEHVTGRGARNALDVGCGEGRWLRELRRLRPAIRYTGVDPSPYVVARFGRARHLCAGSFGDLGRLGLRGEYDLVVCTDVLHYLTDAEIDRGLPELAARVRGALYVDAATREDHPVGDLAGWQDRPASWYRRRLARAGLVELGLGCWARAEARDSLPALELP